MTELQHKWKRRLIFSYIWLILFTLMIAIEIYLAYTSTMNVKENLAFYVILAVTLLIITFAEILTIIEILVLNIKKLASALIKTQYFKKLFKQEFLELITDFHNLNNKA